MPAAATYMAEQPRSSGLPHIVPPVAWQSVHCRQAPRAPQTCWQSASVSHEWQTLLAMQ